MQPGNRGLQVVVPVEFRRMGNLRQLQALGPLGLDEVIQQNLREHATGSQIIMICLQGIQRLLQRGGQALQLLLLFLRQVEQIHVVGTPSILMRIDLILDTVKTGHQNGGVAEIGIAGGIGITQLKATLRRSLRVSRNPDDRAAVRGCVTNRNRGLNAIRPAP